MNRIRGCLLALPAVAVFLGPVDLAESEDTVWTAAVGVSVSGNSLTKTAATNWGNAGAVSTQSLASGDGYVEFTAQETNTSRMLGLSNGDSNLNYDDIDFAVYLYGNSTYVYEKGSFRGTFGAYAAGDKLRVSVSGGVVRYSRNGTMFYASHVAPTYPLLVDTSLYSAGATLVGAVVSGNWTAMPPPPPPPGGEAVVWTSAAGVSISGNNLTKTAATNWGNAGAVSTGSLVSGDGYVEFIAQETNTYRMLGLSNGNSNLNYDDIDFAIYPNADGSLRVYEKGISRGGFGTYAAGDKLRVSVTGGVVRYSRNGTVLYTSPLAPTYPLLVDTSLYSAGATLIGAIVSGNWTAIPPPPPPPPSSGEAVVWTSAAGVGVSGSSLTKTAATNWGNAGAVSTKSLASGDGFVEFTAQETNTYRMLGLSNGNSNLNWDDLDFALYLNGDARIQVYEKGVLRGAFGGYTSGDKMRAAIVSGVVKYSRNGTVFYTSPAAPVYPLLVDTSLYTSGATLTSVVIGGSWSGGAPPPPPPPPPAPSGDSVVWTAAVGVSISGSSLTKTAATGWGNAGAVSAKSLASGDGFVEFTAQETNTYRMLGLSNGDSNLSWDDLDFALYLNGDARIQVYEKGVWRGAFGSYASGDRMRVAVVSGVVKYSRNGTVFYTSPAAPVYPLLVDTSLYTSGATLTSVVTGGSWSGGPVTLYLANMLSEGMAVSLGFGNSTLLLAPDEKSALIRFTYSNLTTPVTAAHIHGPADPGQNAGILFDFDTAPTLPDGSFTWVFAPVGGVTPAQIVSALKAGRLYLNVHTSRYPNGEVRGHYRLSQGSSTFVPPPPPPPLPSGPPTARDAARFLIQATYGPTAEEIAALQARGFDAWLAEQFARPIRSHVAYLDAAKAAGEELGEDQTMESIWEQALTGGDQLRQRVALALSEILVVSSASGPLEDEPYGLSGYMDVLARNAFGNFRQLLKEVTLSPSMGLYLDMLRNDKEDPKSGRIPNENYAREVLQLFSVGLYKLHPDGRLVLDSRGEPIPTYNQETVIGFAHTFTGWSWGGNPKDNRGWYQPAVKDFTRPMEAWPTRHSSLPKRLLNGVVLPAGRTAEQDLEAALDNIFNHPNVGPFIARQLIQRLVTGNPSPAYVYRAASKFDDNGAGVRGDMKAVLRAILLDYEARSPDAPTQQGYGKQKEPIVRFGGVLRAFKAKAPSGKFRIWHLEDARFQLGQNPLRAPTVFNFFEPGYANPGPIADAGLVSPEFQITNETTVIGSANFMRRLANRGYGQNQDLISLDLAPWLPLAGDPTALVDKLGLVLAAGGLASGTKDAVVTAVLQTSSSQPDKRVRTAIHLVITSPDFVIQR